MRSRDIIIQPENSGSDTERMSVSQCGQNCQETRSELSTYYLALWRQGLGFVFFYLRLQLCLGLNSNPGPAPAHGFRRSNPQESDCFCFPTEIDSNYRNLEQLI